MAVLTPAVLTPAVLTPAGSTTAVPWPELTGAYRGELRRVAWDRVSHGLYLPRRPEWTRVDELRAWSLVLPPEAAFTSLTAAAVRGWWRPAISQHPTFVAIPDVVPRPRRRGLYVTRHPHPLPTATVAGISVTSAAETLLAASRDLGVLDIVILADSALRLGHCTVAELAMVARQRRRGAPRLRTVIPLLDSRSESPWESVMRVLHVAAQIPVEPQYEIHDDSGQFVARADLRVSGTQRVHEYDGEVHRDGKVHARDLTRDRHLVQAGWERIGFTARHLLREAPSIVTATDILLGRRGDPQRLRAWQQLIDDSLFGCAGRSRVFAHWRRAH